MMTFYVRGKNCKDQMVLLLHEPQSANLIYNFFVDKSYNNEIQEAAIRVNLKYSINMKIS